MWGKIGPPAIFLIINIFPTEVICTYAKEPRRYTDKIFSISINFYAFYRPKSEFAPPKMRFSKFILLRKKVYISVFKIVLNFSGNDESP